MQILNNRATYISAMNSRVFRRPFDKSIAQAKKLESLLELLPSSSQALKEIKKMLLKSLETQIGKEKNVEKILHTLSKLISNALRSGTKSTSSLGNLLSEARREIDHAMLILG